MPTEKKIEEMNIQKQAERLNKANKLIQEEKTGSPKEFADKLNISRSQLYNIIDILKEYDAPVKYSKKTNSFYYSKPFDLEFRYSLTIILDKEKREIFGGSSLHPILVDANIVYLQQQNILSR